MRSIIISKLFLFAAIVISFNAYSQENKTVTLVVSGQGSTKDEAKQNALRSAIEQAFGTFISSKTEILNDDLVKDEIVSVANGNIQKFEIISEVQIPDGNYATTLNATVSVSKLISFVESKGGTVEFKGGLFATNILMQELYEKNERNAVNNLIFTLEELSKNSFDHSISPQEPVNYMETWNIPITIDVIPNPNFINLSIIFEKTIKNISLSVEEATNYSRLNKPIYPITILTLNSERTFYLRNKNSYDQVFDFIISFNKLITDFSVSNGVQDKHFSKYEAFIKPLDDNFRILLFGGYLDGTCDFNVPSIFGISYHYIAKSYDGTGGYNESNEFEKVVIGYNLQNKYNYVRLSSNCTPNYMYPIVKDKKSPFYINDLWPKNNSEVNLGLVISFKGIKTNSTAVKFTIVDTKTIEEIKKIKEYKILKY
jgi:hypothetical protein